jgi:Flp pilus assembly protein TadD
MSCIVHSPWTAAQAAESVAVKEQIEQGDSLMSEDQFDRAISLYRKAVSSAPNDASAHQRLGKALSLTGNLQGAEREMRRAIQLDPNDALAHSNLGMILGMEKNYADSVIEERIAIQLDAGDSFSYRTMGLALASLGYYDDAIKAFQKAIELEPDSLKAYLNLGATLGRKGDFANAIEAYKDALILNPKSVSALLGLGAALGKTGDLQGQIEQYRLAVALAPGNDNAHGRLGWALYRNGHWQGALKEGWTTNWLRLSRHGPEYLQFFLSFWAGVFLLFGLLFATLMFGSRFKPLSDEQVVKSYFLTLHKDRPGRFVITNKRLVFVPEAFSRSFGATVVSIDKEQINTIESKTTSGGGILILELKDGTEHQFRIPLLVLKPLLEALSEATQPPAAPPTHANAPSTLAAQSMGKLNARITGEFQVPDLEERARQRKERLEAEKRDGGKGKN